MAPKHNSASKPLLSKLDIIQNHALRIATRTYYSTLECMGWSGGAMVLGELPVPGRPTIWMIVGQGPIVLAVGAGGGCLDIFTLLSFLFSFSLSLGDGPI